jgi:hypothetical protein
MSNKVHKLKIDMGNAKLSICGCGGLKSVKNKVEQFIKNHLDKVKA